MKIVLAFDKFKGSATSVELADAACEAIVSIFPHSEVLKIPIADGGDGTVDALAASYPAAQCVSCTVDAPLPALQPVEAQYIIDEQSRTALMELSAASGLVLVPPHARDVMKASTAGTGQMILDAIAHGCNHIIIGLGGSATNDCATGLLAALGFEFLDAGGHPLYPCGEHLGEIAQVDRSGVAAEVRNTHFTLIGDVDNVLCGPQGCARVYAPQKGATHWQTLQLDEGARHFAHLLPPGLAATPGAGAAGGTAAGMLAFLDAELCPGIEAVLNLIQFDRKITGADFVFTGEGRIDTQTAMSKAPMGVLRAARKQGIPVIALCGGIASGFDADTLGFDAVFSITPAPMTLAQAMQRDTCLHHVKRQVTQIMRLLKREIS